MSPLLSHNRSTGTCEPCERCSRVQVLQVAYTTPGRRPPPGCPGGIPPGLPQHHRFVDGGGAGGTGRPARRAVAERRHCAQEPRGSHGSPRQPAPGDRRAAASDTVLQHIPSGCGSGRQQGVVQSLNPALAQLLELPVSSALGRPLQQLCPELDLQQALRDGGGEGKPGDPAGLARRGQQSLRSWRMAERTGLVLTCQDITAVQRGSTHPLHSPSRCLHPRVTGSNNSTARDKVNREMFAAGQRLPPTIRTILITGESGTGKELLAQGSRREPSPARAFRRHQLRGVSRVATREANCSATRKAPSTVRAKRRQARPVRGGAPWHAVPRRIGDMPVSLQTRLLRVLRARGLAPGRHRAISIDVRIVAATHKRTWGPPRRIASFAPTCITG